MRHLFKIIIVSNLYLFDLEFLTERESSLLADFDCGHNLFEYEENSASHVLKGDGCSKRESLQVASSTSLFVQTSLSTAVFVANSTKSLWDPAQLTLWLGLHWNLVSGSISITDRRIPNFIALLDDFAYAQKHRLQIFMGFSVQYRTS